MTHSIQGTWDKFERWANRYTKVCHGTIEEMFDWEYFDFNRGLFLQKWYELTEDISVTASELYTRVSNKIKFLRGYLVDISFDGPEFMAKHSNFLTLQYPGKCNNSMGVWLEQDLEGEIEAGSYFGFMEFDVSFFCKSFKDVDLSSMRNILPFDRMFVRLPKGQNWDTDSINNVVKQIKEDLEFDYSVKIQTDGNESGMLLLIRFTWE